MFIQAITAMILLLTSVVPGTSALGILDSSTMVGSVATQPLTETEPTRDRLTDIVEVVAGTHHTCARDRAGGVLCWGNNVYGQLGDGVDLDLSMQPNLAVPTQVVGLDEGIVAIAAGASHTCALTDSGEILCWGDDSRHQLGFDPDTCLAFSPYNLPSGSSLPVQVSSLTEKATALATGAYHTCALTTAGEVMCWGYNAAGQLGDGATESHWEPVRVVDLEDTVIDIAAGVEHTCALTELHTVLCWGSNAAGQLGTDGSGFSSTPVVISGLSDDVAAIAAGGEHTCALTETGEVLCWGYGGYGQLGNAAYFDSDGQPSPLPVTDLPDVATVIAAGLNHTCAIVGAGDVYCWGFSGFGQLGTGTREYLTVTPEKVVDFSNALDIGTGGYHSCGIDDSGAVACWGFNRDGQIGNGEIAFNNPEQTDCCDKPTTVVAAEKRYITYLPFIPSAVEMQIR